MQTHEWVCKYITAHLDSHTLPFAVRYIFCPHTSVVTPTVLFWLKPPCFVIARRSGNSKPAFSSSVDLQSLCRNF
jgi:hypothetical protein